MRWTYLAVLSTVALVATGCGDDKKAPSKADYITKADKICVDAKTKAKTFQKQLDALPANASVKDAVPAIKGGLDVQRKFTKQLRDEKRPSDDDSTLDSYFDSLDKTLTAGQKFLDAAKSDDLAKVKQVGTDANGVKADRKRLAKQYGFKHCA